MNEPEPNASREVRRKIGEVEATIEADFVRTPEQERQVLKARAKELAREPKAADVEADWIEVVEFSAKRFDIDFHPIPVDRVGQSGISEIGVSRRS